MIKRPFVEWVWLDRMAEGCDSISEEARRYLIIAFIYPNSTHVQYI
jgi:hypothetical protein